VKASIGRPFWSLGILVTIPASFLGMVLWWKFAAFSGAWIEDESQRVDAVSVTKIEDISNNYSPVKASIDAPINFHPSDDAPINFHPSDDAESHKLASSRYQEPATNNEGPHHYASVDGS
jgi:hypothetical protein